MTIRGRKVSDDHNYTQYKKKFNILKAAGRGAAVYAIVIWVIILSNIYLNLFGRNVSGIFMLSSLICAFVYPAWLLLLRPVEVVSFQKIIQYNLSYD